MHYTSLFLPLSVSVKGSILRPFFILYGVCTVFRSHTPSALLLVSLLTISHSSWSPASSSTHKTWHVTAYLYYYTLKKYVCMCVWVCAHTCAAMFRLIEAPNRHIGQIDQLVCQLSLQISPSVSLFLLPAPRPLPFTLTLWHSYSQFNSIHLMKRQSKDEKNISCKYWSALPYIHQRFHTLPLADGRWPVLTDVTLPGIGCRRPSEWSLAVENDERRAKPAPFVIWAAHIVLIYPIIRRTFPRWAGKMCTHTELKR